MSGRWRGSCVPAGASSFEYLPSSVEAFHSRESLADILRGAGLTEVAYSDLMFGKVVIHRGVKPLAVNNFSVSNAPLDREAPR